MATQWRYRAEVIAACNCDWGCPCNFNARPSYGFCAGGYGFRIITGMCGETSLDGVKFATMAKWPGAIHEGGGVMRILIEETASQQQRTALEGIVMAKFGGMPWSIFAATVDRWAGTAYVPFEWHFDEHRSRYKAGTEVRVTLDFMRNPVTGIDATSTVLLPNGITAKQLELTQTKTFSVFSEGLKIAAPGKYGFYAMTEHST